MSIKLILDPAIFRWQARHGEKMTYAELAKRAGISEPTIYRLTSGQPTKLDLSKLNRICKVLECGPGDLLERIDTARVGTLEETAWHMQQRAEDLATIRQHAPTESFAPLPPPDTGALDPGRANNAPKH